MHGLHGDWKYLKRVQLWSWKHRILGAGLMVLSVVNIFSGMAKHDIATISKWLFVAWLMVIASAFIGVHSYKRYKISVAQEEEPCETITPMQPKDRNGNNKSRQAIQFQATVGSLPPLQTPSTWCENWTHWRISSCKHHDYSTVNGYCSFVSLHNSFFIEHMYLDIIFTSAYKRVVLFSKMRSEGVWNLYRSWLTSALWISILISMQLRSSRLNT